MKQIRGFSVSILYEFDRLGGLLRENWMVDRLCDFISEMKDYYKTEHYVFVCGRLSNEGGKIVSDWRNASWQQ